MPTSRQPLQNILWLVGERVGRAAITATVLGLVARHLEPAGFGRLHFAVTLMTAAAALASLGLESLVVNELVRRPAQAGAVLGTALRLRLVAAVVTASLLGLGALVLAPGDAALIAVVGLGLVFQPAEVVDLWFQRHLDSRRTVVARTIAILTGALLRLGLVAADAPLIAFAWAQAADLALVGAALAVAAARSPYRTGAWTWDPALARDLARRGAPLALAALAVAFALRLDQILVRAWLGEAEVGTYLAATRLIDLANFAGAALAVSFFPALAGAHARDPAEFRRRLQGLFDALSALGWAAALGCTLLAPWIVRLIFGAGYAETVPILQVQGWFALIALNATGRWHYVVLAAPAYLNLLAALIHVALLAGLASWLVPRHGAAGAALALVGASAASGWLLGYTVPSLRACAAVQSRGLLILFTPGRWRGLLQQFTRSGA